MRQTSLIIAGLVGLMATANFSANQAEANIKRAATHAAKPSAKPGERSQVRRYSLPAAKVTETTSADGLVVKVTNTKTMGTQVERTYPAGIKVHQVAGTTPFLTLPASVRSPVQTIAGLMKSDPTLAAAAKTHDHILLSLGMAGMSDRYTGAPYTATISVYYTDSPKAIAKKIAAAKWETIVMNGLVKQSLRAYGAALGDSLRAWFRY